MPYYNYQCKNCLQDYTYLHHGPDDKTPVCPHCASKEAERKIALTGGHVLRGGGWYKDGYHTKKTKR